MISYDMADAIFDGECRGPVMLTVLYDRRCPLCRRLRAWLASQGTLVAMEFLAAGSDEARRRFPSLDHERTRSVLTVVAQDGSYYEAERAWLVCAWALPRWRGLAEHFSRPGRLVWVRVGARLVDGYRHRRLDSAGGVGCDRQCPSLVAPGAWPAR